MRLYMRYVRTRGNGVTAKIRRSDMDSEKSIEDHLIKRMRCIGGRAYKFVSPGNVGVPDRIAIFPSGKIIFVELKREAGKLSKMQKCQIKRLESLAQDVRVINSKADINSLVDEFGGAK